MSVPAAIFRLLVDLAPLYAIPAALMLFIRPGGRLAFFLLGLLFMFVVSWLIGPSGPDNPMLAIPLLGLCVSLGAVLAEAVVRLFRLALRLRAGPPVDQD